MNSALYSPQTALKLSAIFSAALVTSSPVSAQFAHVLAKQQIRWAAPSAAIPSFASHGVLHGSIVATTAGIEPDPWQELEALEDDWDANGARAISRDAIAYAKAFVASISTLVPSFTPFAHPDGSVGLESQKGSSAAYLIVSESGHLSYVLRVGQTVHRGDNVEAEKMQELLALLY